MAELKVWNTWEEYAKEHGDEPRFLYRSPWQSEVQAYMQKEAVKPRWPATGRKDEIMASSSVIPNHVAGAETPTPLVGVCVRKRPAADFKSDDRQKGEGEKRGGILVVREPEDKTCFIGHDEATKAMEKAPPTDRANFHTHNEAFFVNEIPFDCVVGWIKQSFVGVSEKLKEGSRQLRAVDEDQKQQQLRDAKMREVSRAKNDREAKKIIDKTHPDTITAMLALGETEFKANIKTPKSKLEDADCQAVWDHLQTKAA